MNAVLKQYEERTGLCLKPPRDLPADYKERFHPTTFIPRRFLESLKNSTKGEFKSSILTCPPNVAGYESNGHYRRAVTWDMIMQRRREKQKNRLEEINNNLDCNRGVKPLYVWVFWCPGISGIFRGWYIYLIGHDFKEGSKFGLGGNTEKKLMELFPLVTSSLFAPADIEKWKIKFTKQFQRGTWCGKPQGKALVWAEMRGNRIERILSRAEWPQKTGTNNGP